MLLVVELRQLATIVQQSREGAAQISTINLTQSAHALG